MIVLKDLTTVQITAPADPIDLSDQSDQTAQNAQIVHQKHSEVAVGRIEDLLTEAMEALLFHEVNLKYITEIFTNARITSVRILKHILSIHFVFLEPVH